MLLVSLTTTVVVNHTRSTGWGQQRLEVGGDLGGVSAQAQPGDPDDAPACECELGVAQAIALELPAGGVRGGTVELGDQALGPPEGVDLVRAPGSLDPGVDLGRREPVASNDVQEGGLELAAGSGRAGIRIGEYRGQRGGAVAVGMTVQQRREGDAVEDPLNLGLVHGALELAAVEDRGEVQERACGRRDRDGLDGCALVRGQDGAMELDAIAGAKRTGATHLGASPSRRADAPQRRR